ncbi:MAG: hypothetical protein RI885_473 [Actinomycetota bacterium]|jgi:Tfp pilus assembly protein PilO
MTKTKIWMIGSLAIAGLILLAGYFVGVSPLLAQASLSDAATRDAQAQNTANESTLAQLEVEFAQLPDLAAKLAATTSSVPATANMPDFLAQVEAAQVASGSKLTNFAQSDAQPYIPVAAAVDPSAAPVEPAADETATDAAAGESAVQPAAAEIVPASSAAASVLNAQFVTGSNFAVIPVSMESKGTLDQVLAFITAVQNGPRLYLVTKLDITFDETEGGFTANMDGFVYSLDTESVAAVADPGATASVDTAGADTN